MELSDTPKLAKYLAAAAVFLFLLEFDETRWYDASEQQKKSFLPFGAGATSCVGANLAWMEFRFAAAFFFREFRGAYIAKTTTDEDMEPRVYMVGLSAKGGHCDVTFRKKLAHELGGSS